MSINWINEQTRLGVAQFDRAMIKMYPESNTSVENCDNYLNTIGGICNYNVAIDQIPWINYIKSNAKVLDLGCGGGWLSAILSKLDAVEIVYELDSSRHFLHEMLPQVMTEMGGGSAS